MFRDQHLNIMSMSLCYPGLWVWPSGSCSSWATSPTDTTLTDKYWPTLWESSSCDCPNRCSKCPWLSAGETLRNTYRNTVKIFNKGEAKHNVQRNTIKFLADEWILISSADSNYHAYHAGFVFPVLDMFLPFVSYFNPCFVITNYNMYCTRIMWWNIFLHISGI